MIKLIEKTQGIMAISTEGYLQGKVSAFIEEERAFSTALTTGRFASETRATEAFKRVQALHFSLLAEIHAHINTFSDGHDGIVEDQIDLYIDTTEIHDKLVNAFRHATKALQTHYPSTSASAATIIAPLRDHTPKSLLFYYAGKGDLYIHGENLTILDERGMPKPLTWPEGLPLRLIADNLWEGTVYIPPKGEGKYKVSNNAGWSKGENIAITPATPTKLQTPTFEAESSTSFCLPLKIIPEAYTLAILGEGTIKLPSGATRGLTWDAGLEMTRMGTALWRADFIASGEVKYKFCLVSPAGEKIWETGEDRTIVPGEPISYLPNFPIIEEVRIEELSPERIKREPLIRTKLDEMIALETAHKHAAGGAGRAVAASSTGFVFEPAEIIEQHFPVEFARIDGTPIDFGAIRSDDIIIARARGGKWVLFQQGATGCTAGASAFLMLDIGIVPAEALLKERTTACLATIDDDLKARGIGTIRTHIRNVPTFPALKSLLDANGSIALRIVTKAEVGHAIVVDEISADLKTVRLRDPWHGWDVTVTAGAFVKYWKSSVDTLLTTYTDDYLIQVDRKKHASIYKF